MLQKLIHILSRNCVVLQNLPGETHLRWLFIRFRGHFLERFLISLAVRPSYFVFFYLLTRMRLKVSSVLLGLKLLQRALRDNRICSKLVKRKLWVLLLLNSCNSWTLKQYWSSRLLLVRSWRQGIKIVRLLVFRRSSQVLLPLCRFLWGRIQVPLQVYFNLWR